MQYESTLSSDVFLGAFNLRHSELLQAAGPVRNCLCISETKNCRVTYFSPRLDILVLSIPAILWLYWFVHTKLEITHLKSAHCEV